MPSFNLDQSHQTCQLIEINIKMYLRGRLVCMLWTFSLLIHSRGIPHWRIKSSSIKQSTTYKWHLQERKSFWVNLKVVKPFTQSLGVLHWWVESSGVRQSQIQKWYLYIGMYVNIPRSDHFTFCSSPYAWSLEIRDFKALMLLFFPFPSRMNQRNFGWQHWLKKVFTGQWKQKDRFTWLSYC